jgi:hypothetical protein
MIRKATTNNPPTTTTPKKAGRPKSSNNTTAKRNRAKPQKKQPHRIETQNALTYMAKVNANFHQTDGAQTYRCPENHVCITPFCLTCNIRAMSEAKKLKMA